MKIIAQKSGSRHGRWLRWLRRDRAATSLPVMIPLTSVHCLDARHVGTKAARLAAMAQAGFPVPPGFVVGVAAFRRFCRRHGLTKEGAFDAAAAGQAVWQYDLPADIAADIAAAAETLGTHHLAVRSSSTDEDLQNYSMAGQFETFLNTPAVEVAAKVRQCWASLFKAAPRAYRRKLSVETDAGMGVIVQAQVDARWAGVIFTIDPVQKSADHFVVEWVTGLAEDLVSGRVTPQRLFVRRDQFALPANLPEPLARVLRDACHWARQAEQLFQQPIDMEWAADAKGLQVLQARPVTALPSDECVVWTNVNMAENFPQPLRPLAWSLVDRFYIAYTQAILRQLGWREQDLARAAPVTTHLTGVHAGRIYYRLNNWYALMRFLPVSRWLIRFLNAYIGQKVPFQYRPSETDRRAVSRWRRGRTAVFFWPCMLQLGLSAARRMRAFESAFMGARRQWRRVPYARLSAWQIYQQLGALLNFVQQRWQPPAMADLLVMILPALLNLLTRRWLPGEAETVTMRLYQGLDLVSIRPSVLIWETAQQIKAEASLYTTLMAGDDAALEEKLPASVRKLVRHFMTRFGGRCFHDCMIVAPTFEERRDLFWDLVRRYAAAGVTHPLSAFATQRRQREKYVQTLTSRLGPLKRLIYLGLLKLAQQALALRERGRLLQSLLFGEMRHMVVALGGHLHAKGVLAAAEEIFYLHLEEIEALLNGKFQFPETIPQMIRMRQKALEANAALEPPAFFFLNRGEILRVGQPASEPQKRPNLLIGTGVANGQAVAPARVILDPLQGPTLQQGDILVTRATDPGWTPLFCIAGGLVLERGGLLSHGAIVAREFGIPAVVGIENATRIIADGQQVAVDGYQGTVRLV